MALAPQQAQDGDIAPILGNEVQEIDTTKPAEAGTETKDTSTVDTVVPEPLGDLDFEDTFLREAEAEAAQEDQVPESNDAESSSDQQGDEQSQEQVEGGAQQQDVMIPKARFDQQRVQAEQQIQALQAQLEEQKAQQQQFLQALQAQQKPAEPELPKEPSPSEQISVIDQKLLQLAKDYDENKISDFEKEQQRLLLEGEKLDIRQKVILNALEGSLQSQFAKQAEERQQASSGMNGLERDTVQRHQSQLMQQFPDLQQLPENVSRMMADMAVAHFKTQGHEISPDPRNRTYQEEIAISNYMAKASPHFARMYLGKSHFDTQQQQPQPQQTQRDQRADKVKLANQLPPNTNSIPGATGHSALTENAVNDMPFEELVNMTDAELDKLLG